jgi:nucleoside-diphosphate-sugar epimerase
VTVLVTGGTGVIGRWVVRVLAAQGEQVHVVARTSGSARLPPGAVPHDVDLLDEQAVTRLLAELQPRKIVHLAWETAHGRFWESPQNADWERATTRLVREARDRRAERVVVAGTCAEYDWTQLEETGGRCDERSTPLRPATAYGRAKLRTLEHLSSLPAAASWLAWGRVFSPYGPGEAPGRLVPSLVTSLLEGRPAHVANPTLVRDYLHAEQVGRGLVALLHSGVGGAVNVASGVPMPLGELARCVADAAGRPELVQLGTGAPQSHEPARLVADVARLRDEVGFRPDVDLAAGLRDVVAWWRAPAP